MKRFLTLCAATACLGMLQAQPASTPSWTGTLNNVVSENSDLYRSAPVALTAAGNVYATGKFNQTVASSKFFLEPVAQSSYLAKYDKDGNEQWAVALAGTATITSVATDAEENVYIAGILADEVIFNTTSGESVTLAGKQEWGDYVTTQAVSFIAKYNANGVLQTVKSISTEEHPNAYDNPDIFYLPEDGHKVQINHIAIDGDKLYATALFCGKLVLDQVNETAGLYTVGGFMIDDVPAAIVFCVSTTDLSEATTIATIKSHETITDDTAYYPSSISLTAQNGAIYIGSVGIGQLDLSTASGTQEFKFTMDGENTEYGHIIAAIASDNTIVKSYSAPASDRQKGNEAVNAMQLSSNGSLYIGGLFYDVLPYDKSVTATNITDLFVASLNPATLEVTGTWVSGYDEQETNVNQENFTSMLVDGSTVYLNGYSDKMSGHAINESLTYIIRDGNISAGAMDGVVTGSAKNGTSIVFNAITGDVNTTVSYYANSVTPVTAAKSDAGVKAVYADGELLLSTEADVEVYALSGLNVATVRGANKVNLSNLTNGCYIAKMTTAEGVSVLKFIKK